MTCPSDLRSKLTLRLVSLSFSVINSSLVLIESLVTSGRPIPILFAAEVTQFRVLPLLPIVVLSVGVRERQGNLDRVGVRRAELEAKVSAMKRGETFAEASRRGLPELLKLCLLGGTREDSLSVALLGSRCTLWPISANCCGIIQ